MKYGTPTAFGPEMSAIENGSDGSTFSTTSHITPYL